MNKLSIDFAFEGFRIIREKPGLIVAWGLVLLIGNGIGLAAALPLAWPTLKVLFSGAAFPTEPMAMFSLIGGLFLPCLILIIVTVIVRSIVDCAVLRLVLESPQKSFGYMRFGSDEMRIIGFGIVMGLLIFAFSFVCSLASSMIGMVLTLALSKTSAAGLGVVVQMLLYYGAVYYIQIKLSLAKAQTFKEKSLNFFGSWKLTDGSVLTLLLGYIVLGILMFVVVLLCLIVFFVVMAIALSAGGVSTSVFTDHMTPQQIFALLPQFSYVVAIYVGFISLVVSPLMVALITGAPAAAYKIKVGVGRSQVENIF